LFLLRTIVVVIVVIALFLYCTFTIIYSTIRLSSRKCVINSVFSVLCVLTHFTYLIWCAAI